MFDEKFWLAVSLLLLFYLVYKPLFRIITGLIDQKILKIKSEIEEVEEVIGESNSRLKEVKTKHEKIEKEIQQILQSAEKEIANLKESSVRDLTSYLNKRMIQIMDKISSSEAHIINELKIESVEIATKVAETILKDYKLDNKKLVENSFKKLSSVSLN